MSLFEKRLILYKKLEEEFDSKIIAFATSDRQNAETHIMPNQVDYFVEHLDKIGKTKKITLLLYTCGGNTLAAWNIINLLYEYCDEVQVLIPNKCRSAGTLMALGATKIIMTKQATLGPIDPSLAGPLSPIINVNGNNIQIPISVESVNAYFELLRNVVKAKDNISKKEAFIKLSNNVNPLLLGDVYRAKKQIKMLGQKLIKKQKLSHHTSKRIIDFLCKDSGSHDYTISRTEAKELGLKVESPTPTQYELLKEWFNNMSLEFSLVSPFDPAEMINNGINHYEMKRVLIESLIYGSFYQISKGVFSQVQLPNGTIQIQDRRAYDGWGFEKGATKNG